MIKSDENKIYACTIDNKLVKKITVDDKAVVDTVSGMTYQQAFEPTTYASGNVLTVPCAKSASLRGKYVFKKESFKIHHPYGSAPPDSRIVITIGSATAQEDLCRLDIYFQLNTTTIGLANIDISGNNAYEEFTIGDANSGIYMADKYSILTLYIENDELKLSIGGETKGLNQREYTLASVYPADYPFLHLYVKASEEWNNEKWMREIYINAGTNNQYIVGYYNPLI